MSLFAYFGYDFLLYLPISALAIAVWSWVNHVFFSPLSKLPGPPYGPIYGNVKEAARGEAMETSVSWVKKYGGVVRFYHFFGRERLLVADPESIKHVLVTNSKNYPRISGGLVQRLVPWGLFSTEGDVHRFQKKLMMPSFNMEAIKKMIGTFRKMAEDLAEVFQQASPGEVNVQQLLRATTMDVICQSAFGYNIKALIDPNSEDVRAMGTILAMPQLGLLEALPFFRYLPLKRNRDLQHAISVVDRVIYRMISEKRALQSSRQPGSETEDEKGDLLDLLLVARDSETGVAYTDKQLHDHVMTFVIAGHETTSIVMTWLLLEVARHPDVQQRLRQEILDVFPTEACHAVAKLESYEKLKYLACCIKETLRLYPPASSIVRVSAKDDTINGFAIPAGTQVIAHLGAMMRTCWSGGEQFKPERFLDAASEASKFLPFAIGPHTCIGNKFALLEMKVILSCVLRKLIFTADASKKFVRKNVVIMIPRPDVTLNVISKEID